MYEVGSGPLMFLVMIIGIVFSLFLFVGFGLLVALPFFLLFFFGALYLSLLVDQIFYTLLYLTLIEKKKVKGLKLR